MIWPGAWLYRVKVVLLAWVFKERIWCFTLGIILP
jgi:hypothetical protein